MPRRSLLPLAAIAANALAIAGVGCGGILEEDPSDPNPLLGEVITPACADDVAATVDGHHHPGDDCLTCHRQGGDGPPYSVAGTLYQDSGGTAAAAGVTLHFLDGNGADVAVVTAANGNFWAVDPVSAPMVAFAARCPNVVPMQTAIRADDASCNRGACHTSGFRVHP